jgi:hypothetical protein
LSCWAIAAGRAPTGGKFTLPPVRVYPAQKVPPLTKNPQQNECLNNVQSLAPTQLENENPQRNYRCKHYQLPGIKLSKLNPPAASNMLILCETITSEDHEKS